MPRSGRWRSGTRRLRSLSARPRLPMRHRAGAGRTPAASGRNASLPEMLGPTRKFLLIGYFSVIPLVTYVPDLAVFLPRVLLGIG